MSRPVRLTDAQITEVLNAIDYYLTVLDDQASVGVSVVRREAVLHRASRPWLLLVMVDRHG